MKEYAVYKCRCGAMHGTGKPCPLDRKTKKDTRKR